MMDIIREIEGSWLFCMGNFSTAISGLDLSNFLTHYALPRFYPISRLTWCSLFDRANLIELTTEIAARLRFFA